MEIKPKLYSYYLELLNEISNNGTEKHSSYNLEEYKDLNINEIIERVKDSTKELIKLKISQNENDKNNYYQLESYVKKLESDIKLFYHNIFEYKILNDVLEDKIKMYKLIQEEYEELKDKVKFIGGKFLDNEKKDNEIIILRQENNILKKEVDKLERMNKQNENLKNKYLNKINDLQNEIEQLNKKLETKYITSNSISNYNISNASNINNNGKKLSKCISRHDNEIQNNIQTNYLSGKNSHNHHKCIKNSFQKNSIYNNKRPSNYNMIKNIYMSSNNNKNTFNISSISTINTNIFTSNYNKILNNFSQKKSNPKSKIKNIGKNKSIKIDREDEKSLSLNKNLKSNNDSRFIYKSESKSKKSYNKFINYKSNENYPMSCQHKSSSKIGKSVNKKIRNFKNNNDKKMKKSNSALNIKIVSK